MSISHACVYAERERIERKKERERERERERENLALGRKCVYNFLPSTGLRLVSKCGNSEKKISE